MSRSTTKVSKCRPVIVTLQSPFHLTPSPAYDYVVTKNNHYIIVDALHLPLHYAAVSLIGSAAKRY
ncbi:hypothetical protein PSPTOT1_3371 [Pseudomonas syringae pv. tomato T1]|nr:hypothetical protein PSPTOT1_3371 [Pseudomonas syringae pv. tomato T1]